MVNPGTTLLNVPLLIKATAMVSSNEVKLSKKHDVLKRNPIIAVKPQIILIVASTSPKNIGEMLTLIIFKIAPNRVRL
jgi:hypothetical protein